MTYKQEEKMRRLVAELLALLDDVLLDGDIELELDKIISDAVIELEILEDAIRE